METSPSVQEVLPSSKNTATEIYPKENDPIADVNVSVKTSAEDGDEIQANLDPPGPILPSLGPSDPDPSDPGPSGPDPQGPDHPRHRKNRRRRKKHKGEGDVPDETAEVTEEKTDPSLSESDMLQKIWNVVSKTESFFQENAPQSALQRKLAERDRTIASLRMELKRKDQLIASYQTKEDTLETLTEALEELKESVVASRMNGEAGEEVKSKLYELSSAVGNAVSKMDQMGEDIKALKPEEEHSEDKKRPVLAAGSDFLLHNKVDKVVRLLVENSELQKKATKSIQSLMKADSVVPRSDTAKDPLPPRNDPAVPETRVVRAVEGEPKFDPDRWALNTVLIGDGFWNAFQAVPDIKAEVDRLIGNIKLGFKMIAKDGEVLDHWYDRRRATILKPLPLRVKKVCVSIGSKDLDNEKDLKTLKDFKLSEVRRRNDPILREKATVMRDFLRKLVSQKISVIVLIPPPRPGRIEIFKQWEEILVEVLRELPFPKLKILNLATMTMRDFDEWVTPGHGLTAFGARRLFDALKRTITARDLKTCDMPADWNVEFQELLSHGQCCYRCMRVHPGQCKSMDRACRRCNVVGHFAEVHDVKDPNNQKEIIKVLAYDIFNAPIQFGATPPELRAFEGIGEAYSPPKKKSKRENIRSNLFMNF